MSVGNCASIIFIIAIILPSISLSGELKIESEISAFTVPSADVTLSFINPGRIDQVNVKVGSRVKARQILVKQDDDAEQAQLSIIKAQSEDTSQIEAAEASLDQKKVYLKKLKWAFEKVSATELEIEKAQLDVKIAELQLKIARFENNQNKKKYKEAKIRVDNMRLRSPIAGRVEKVDVEVGESIDGLADAVRIISTNPLWIDVPVPLELSKTLKRNQAVNVIFLDNTQKIVDGKIVFISSNADSASNTLMVRIEVPNSSDRPAGEHVNVSFSTNKIDENIVKLQGDTLADDQDQSEEKEPESPEERVNIEAIEAIVSAGTEQLMAHPERAVLKTYYIQVGSWKNPDNARDMLKRLKKQYPDVYISKHNTFHKIRIPNVTSQLHGSKIITEITEKYNLTPLLIKKDEK
jgi:RND family efflux transporter MFP subunit